LARKGYLSVVKIPEIKLKSYNYYKILKKFFKLYTLCNKCKGRGYIVKGKKTELKDNAVVKYLGIRELEQLKEYDDVKLGDVIKEITQFALWKKRTCKTCKGFRFIKRE